MSRNTHDLLVEIGTEELPPKSLLALHLDFENLLCELLHEARLDFSEAKAYASPRRIAVLVRKLDAHQPDQRLEKLGPAVAAAYDKNGKPTKAAEGFARGCGVAVEDLETTSTDKGERLVYRSTEIGADTRHLLPGIVSQALQRLPIAKRMRWGDSRAEFVRPVHWVMMLFGEQAVTGEVLGVSVGNRTRGHRFHANDWLELGFADDYEQLLLEQGYVIADFSTRRARIAEQVQAQGKILGGRAVIDDDLLDEVTALVEWPVALAGSFEHRFLKVPAEALISSMKEHQKYFHVVDTNDNLMPHFVTVANIESRDPSQVIHGNERVIRPRLDDAAFFFETDCKTSLEAHRERLKDIVFQEKLGTVYDKTERVAALASALATSLNADVDLARRAAQLSKSDLVTEMVSEFPDMQGIAGYYYARNDGENGEVARALKEQYQPRYAGDALPESETGRILALADRLDTVVGIFGIGQAPSGSRDPFALRRACLGILRIIIEHGLNLDLRNALELAISHHGKLPAAQGLEESVLAYIVERLRAWYEDRGIAPEVFHAVTVKKLSHPLDIDRRVQAVHAFSQLPEAQALAAANKRVSNLLSKSSDSDAVSFDPALLHDPAEKALAELLGAKRQSVQPLFAAGRYSEGLLQLAELRERVDNFFDNVMVMVDDTALRNNRLALLRGLRELFLNVADISQLVLSADGAPVT